VPPNTPGKYNQVLAKVTGLSQACSLHSQHATHYIYASRDLQCKEPVILRSDRSKHSFDQELQGLESSVRAVENSVSELRAHLINESTTIPKVKDVDTCSLLDTSTHMHPGYHTLNHTRTCTPHTHTHTHTYTHVHVNSNQLHSTW